MKNLWKIVFAFGMLALLGACTNPNMQTAQSIPDFPESSEAREESTAAEDGEVQWKRVRWTESRTDSGGTDLICFAEVVNTGETPLAVQSLSLNLLGAGGNVLKEAEDVTVYPALLEPGQTGYVAQRVVNSLSDKDFTAAEVQKMKPEGEYWVLKNAEAREVPDIQIGKSDLTDSFGIPNFSCTVTNGGTKETGDFSVICPVYSKDGQLLAVIDAAPVEPLKAGESQVLQQIAVNYDEEADFTSAVWDPFLSY